MSVGDVNVQQCTLLHGYAVPATVPKKPGNPGIVREFCKPGKVREFEIWSGNFV